MGQTEQQILLQKAQQAGDHRKDAPQPLQPPPHIQAEIHQQQQDMRQRGGAAPVGRPPAAPVERTIPPAQVQQFPRHQELAPQALPPAAPARRHDVQLPAATVPRTVPAEAAPAQQLHPRLPGALPGLPQNMPGGHLPDGRLANGRLPDGRQPDGRQPDGRQPDWRQLDEQDHRRRDPGRIIVVPGLHVAPGQVLPGDLNPQRRPPAGYPPNGQQPLENYDPNRGRIQTWDPRQQPLDGYDPRRGQIQRWDSGEQPYYGQDERHRFGDNQPRDWEPWDGHWHRFDAGREFRPPEGNAWGWQDPNRFSRGWNQWFFQQDPNYENWQPTMNQESQAVTSLLDNGNTKFAADALNSDLWQMKGDVYAQNQLLSQVRDTQSGGGASLYLGKWNPDRGTWDQIEVVSPKPEPGYEPDPSYMLQTFE